VKNIQRRARHRRHLFHAGLQSAGDLLPGAGQGQGRQESGRKAGLVVSGAAGKGVDQQMLDLAALVTAQASPKNPKYAHHNTRAYPGRAAATTRRGEELKKARELDPKSLKRT